MFVASCTSGSSVCTKVFPASKPFLVQSAEQFIRNFHTRSVTNYGIDVAVGADGGVAAGIAHILLYFFGLEYLLATDAATFLRARKFLFVGRHMLVIPFLAGCFLVHRLYVLDVVPLVGTMQYRHFGKEIKEKEEMYLAFGNFRPFEAFCAGKFLLPALEFLGQPRHFVGTESRVFDALPFLVAVVA